MRSSRLLPAVVVVASLAALGATVALAVSGSMGGSFGARHRDGFGMMRPSGTPSAWFDDGDGTEVRTLADARRRVGTFGSRLGLRTGEVMRFTNDVYARLDDAQGRPATEVLVDPGTGAVTLEYGPAMMWNTRYGMMATGAGRGSADGVPGGGTMMGDAGMMGGGMMGGGSGDTMMGGGMMGSSGSMMGRFGGMPSWTPERRNTGPVGTEEAVSLANQWLARELPGVVAAEPVRFPGYLTLHTLRDGQVAGMLSVHERTGAVWYHWWHGGFVESDE